MAEKHSLDDRGAALEHQITCVLSMVYHNLRNRMHHADAAVESLANAIHAADAAVAAAPQAEPEAVDQEPSAPALMQPLTPTRDGARDIHAGKSDALEAALSSHVRTCLDRTNASVARLLRPQEQFDELRELQHRDDPYERLHAPHGVCFPSVHWYGACDCYIHDLARSATMVGDCGTLCTVMRANRPWIFHWRDVNYATAIATTAAILFATFA